LPALCECSLDTSACNASKKKGAAARSTRLRRLHFSNRGNSRGFSALRALTLKILESEIQAATEHSEIIPGSIDHAKTQVVSPTAVPCEPKFDTGAKLAEEFGFAAEMVGLRVNSEGIRRSLRVKLVPFAAAENRTETRPCIRR
jgi:hypothetical protein